MAAEEDGELAEVERRERALLDPAVRADPTAVRALLHPAFREVGASGTVWDADGITAALAAEGGRAARASAHDVVATRLASDVVLLTYRSEAGARRAQRSSVWVRHDGVWRLLHHQGTLTT